MTVDDAPLVQRCLRGDLGAHRELVEKYQTTVFGVCFRFLHHRQDAEDVTQEVFVRVFRSLEHWDRARPLRPWILAIAINRCKTWAQQRARRPELVDYLHETVASPEPDDVRELTREIQAGLAELRDEYRLVFVMFHEQDLPYEDIAQAMAKPVGTVKTWLHRARLELMERLRQKGFVPETDHELL